MIIYFGDKWRLKPYDKRNFVLEEFREPKQNGRAKNTEAKWFSCDEYFQDIAHAMKRAYEYDVRAADGSYTPSEAVAKCEEIANRILSFKIED